MNTVFTILSQSILLSIMSLGVYITYKILDFPDMTADGSYTFGATITASLVSTGFSPIVCILLSIIGGAISGMCSGLLHIKLKISNLLSGILLMGMLYSISIRTMNGKANIAIFENTHIFNMIFNNTKKFNILGVNIPLDKIIINSSLTTFIISLLLIMLIKLMLDKFLKTGLGYTLKGTGDNEEMIKSLGINTDTIKVLGLMISNALIALSGSLMAQFLGFADVNMGIGTLVLGIASIIIGTNIFKFIKIMKDSTKIILGTVIYQFAIYFALNTGLQASDLKLVTSIIIIVFMFMSSNKLKVPRVKKMSIRKAKLSKKKGSVENAEA